MQETICVTVLLFLDLHTNRSYKAVDRLTSSETGSTAGATVRRKAGSFSLVYKILVESSNLTLSYAMQCSGCYYSFVLLLKMLQLKLN